MAVEISRDAENIVDWTAAPAEVLRLIASKSSSVEQYLRFTSTCRWWRSAASNLEFSIRLNWLMPVSHRNYTNERVFCDVATSKRHRLDLPQIRGYTCFGSRFGHLIAAFGSNIFLFDPISRASVPLPRLPQGFGQGLGHILKAVLTASPADPDCFVVILYRPGGIIFAKPNDAVWSPTPELLFPLAAAEPNDAVRSPISQFPLLFADFVIFDRFLYCLTLYCGSVAVLDLYSSPPQFKSKLAPSPPRPPHVKRAHAHLGEIGSALCMVVTYGGDDEEDRFAEIFKLDTTNNTTWTRVQSLGNSSLIIQDDINLSTVNADEDHNLVPGCMYFPNLWCADYKVNPETVGALYLERLRRRIYFHRCIYYPTISRHGTPAWVPVNSTVMCIYTRKRKRPAPMNLNPKCESSDIYTRLYPSIRFGATISVKVWIKFLLENMSKH